MRVKKKKTEMQGTDFERAGQKFHEMSAEALLHQLWASHRLWGNELTPKEARVWANKDKGCSFHLLQVTIT